MVYIPEAEEIYFEKTKEYFNEVLSDYANGNYRSAVVMLYSVAICDLLFKLQEVSDIYDDSIAANILKYVEEYKNTSDNRSKSSWEKEFLDNIYRKTELLDQESYTTLNQLYDHRNFSAHPALNSRYELISPSKEITIAFIKSVLEDILIKPPIFVKKIIDMLLKDLSEKKSIYQGESQKLHEYLRRKYFDRMPDSMKKSTFRSLWKLCFCLPDDKECQSNIIINRKAMEFLFSDTDGLIDFMKSDPMFSKTSPDDNCVMNLCVLLACYPQIYKILSDDTKLQIDALIARNNTVRFISWFLCKNKSSHIQKMIDSKNFDKLDKKTFEFVSEQYELSGDIYYFINYCIEYFASSSEYDDANERYSDAINPFLKKMTREQFIRLISAINVNDQIYNRRASYSTNTEIAMAAYPFLGTDFDFNSYQHFTFDKEKIVPSENNSEVKDNNDVDLIF